MTRVKHDIKKENESRVFGIFEQNYVDYPIGLKQHIDKPDFIITCDSGETIGVEIREAVISENEWAQLKFQWKVGNAVLDQLRDKLPFNFSFDLKLHPNTHLNRNEIKRVATEIVEMCVPECIDLGNNQEYYVHHIDLDLGELSHQIQKFPLLKNYKRLPKGINEISINRIDLAPESWNMQGHGMVVPLLTRQTIQAIVNEKEEKLMAYIPCNKYWLIIWETGGIRSYYSGVETFPELETKFEKVFFVSPHKNQLTVIY